MIIFVLLYLTFRRFDEAALIMLSLPFALVGGVWFLYLLGYDLSVATGVGFIAVVSHQGRDRQIGAAQFRINATGESCDASLTVSDEWRKRGVGSFLMQHLIAAAKARGVRHMRAYALSRSGGGDRLAVLIGFQRRLDPRDPATVIYDLSLE